MMHAEEVSAFRAALQTMPTWVYLGCCGVLLGVAALLAWKEAR